MIHTWAVKFETQKDQSASRLWTGEFLSIMRPSRIIDGLLAMHMWHILAPVSSQV